MPGDLLARRLRLSRDLPQPVITWTAEQLTAIERRDGDLLLDAGAGSGKTSVLVERFVRAVLEDGVDVAAILTITFTEKAAAELRDRIRQRLRSLGAADAARATEGAFISTIHGFCARVLRAHALSAGIDPGFVVLDAPESERIAGAAFDDALAELAHDAPGAVDLIAAYGQGPLRAAILATYAQLRSCGELEPRLPPCPQSDAGQAQAAASELERAVAAAGAELAAIADPGVRVLEAMERLARCRELVRRGDVWPGKVDRVRLPGGNGAALTTPVCLGYTEALTRWRAIAEERAAKPVRDLLDRLLGNYGRRYAERKRESSGLDFEDLELLTRELFRAQDELRERYAIRFERIMVDELQDTNAVQLELVESISRGNLFTVGDGQQSIYAFRHADVELFERRGERLAALGARATLQTNFRSRREILDALNSAFGTELGERFTPLRAGRADPELPAADPLVELLVVDKGADWALDGLASPWRLAEAGALADRVAELIEGGAAPRDVVLLIRASTDMRAYERALEERGVPTYVIGGRGYWSHPQVVDVVAYLRALANPREEQALYTVLISPLLGCSLDALVILAAAARGSGRDPWWVLREPGGLLDDLSPADRETLTRFAAWFAAERRAAARMGIDELIDRALERTGYDLAMLAMPGGERRLANVRKLMRLGREYEAAHGRDLRGFLELVSDRESGRLASESRESEAPVEGEGLNAVRLMTIHRAKGLEFEIVCVADLGRAPRRAAEILRVAGDGRLGLRLAAPGIGRRESALDYKAIGEEQVRAQEREERRLFYVAMTRARERLILSGAAQLESWPTGAAGGPIAWIAPVFVGNLRQALAEGVSVVDGDGGVRVRLAVVRPPDVVDRLPGMDAVDRPGPGTPALGLPVAPAPRHTPAPAPPPPPPLSYSSLGEYARCGYRFYVERVLGLPPLGEPRWATASTAAPGARPAAERGVLIHALLERLDFRRPLAPTAQAVAAAAARAGLAMASSPAEAEEMAALVQRFAASELCARLGRATEARREERFAFLLGSGVLVTGALDVLAREPGNRALVVDYKSDRLDGADPAGVVEHAYVTQRLVYALAVLRAGAQAVEVAHCFLELPDMPVSATFSSADSAQVEHELAELSHGVLQREFTVAEDPHRGLCGGCPAEGGLCSWPLELTRRESPDRLF